MGHARTVEMAMSPSVNVHSIPNVVVNDMGEGNEKYRLAPKVYCKLHSGWLTQFTWRPATISTWDFAVQ